MNASGGAKWQGGIGTLSQDDQPLQQAVATLQVAQRMLAGGSTDLAAAHVQMAVDLIGPLAQRPSAGRLMLIDGGRAGRLSARAGAGGAS